MECCADILLDVKELTQCLCEVGYEAGVAVRYHFPWGAKPRDEVMKIEGSNALSSDICGTGDEFSHLRAALVDNSEDDVEAI